MPHIEELGEQIEKLVRAAGDSFELAHEIIATILLPANMRVLEPVVPEFREMAERWEKRLIAISEAVKK